VRQRVRADDYALRSVQPGTIVTRDFADSRRDERFLGRDAVLSMAGAGQTEDVARIL
jgi:hypothetical protein